MENTSGALLRFGTAFRDFRLEDLGVGPQHAQFDHHFVVYHARETVRHPTTLKRITFSAVDQLRFDVQLGLQMSRGRMAAFQTDVHSTN